MNHIYGIPNCNTIKKTLDWFKANELAYTFHDYKKEGIALTKLKAWAKATGWESLLNRKGTTWRGLTPERQVEAATEKGALVLMQLQTSVIKRPVIEWANGKTTVGFDEIVFLQNR